MSERSCGWWLAVYGVCNGQTSVLQRPRNTQLAAGMYMHARQISQCPKRVDAYYVVCVCEDGKVMGVGGCYVIDIARVAT